MDSVAAEPRHPDVTGDLNLILVNEGEGEKQFGQEFWIVKTELSIKYPNKKDKEEVFIGLWCSAECTRHKIKNQELLACTVAVHIYLNSSLDMAVEIQVM